LNKTIQLKPIVTGAPDTIQNMQYQWNPSTGLNCTDCLEPEFNGYADEEYTLRILHSGTCIDTASLIVRISKNEKDGFYVPTAFMPSSDQDDNRVFKAFGVNISKFKMQIYNRSGEKLFESHHISQGWDGIYKGELSRADSYYYYIAYETLDKIKHERKGDFVLMR
jgi:gliding motility-associated-like protein